LNIVLAQIPTKALYGIQVSFMQEVKSRSCTNSTKLEASRGVTVMLKIVCDQLTMEKKEQKDRVDKLEQGVNSAYERIPNIMQIAKPTTTQKIDHIVQTIDQYRQEIENLKEQLSPMTPSKVKEQKRQEVARQMDEMEIQVSADMDLFDREVQLWTVLEEDEQV
jgi:hypothetical protein